MDRVLKHQFKHTGERFYSDLFFPEALSHLSDLSQRLPPASGVVLECRLGEHDPNVDLSICLPADFKIEHLADPIAQDLKLNRYRKVFQDFSHSKQAKANLLSNLTSSPSNYYRQVDQLWLEFDVLESLFHQHAPALGLQLTHKRNPLTSLLGQPANRQKKLVSNLVSTLLDQETFSEIQPQLQQCLDTLPAGAKVVFIGVGPSRQVNAARLIISRIEFHEIKKYLAKSGWDDPTNQLDELVTSLSELVDSIALSFNISDRISPQVGLECYLLNKDWQNFLDYLVNQGICTAAKRKALLDWTGITEELSQYISGFLNRPIPYKKFEDFVRFNFSVKLTYHPHHSLEAKAYLGLWDNIGMV